MPRKKKPETANLPAVVTPVRALVRSMNGSSAMVKVDAVYHVPDVHPKEKGPWEGEADKIAWTDELSGYACIIRRTAPSEGQHLCGYVAVPPRHPLFGRRHGTLVGIGIGVHGGLDYSDACQHRVPEERSICHVPTESAFARYGDEIVHSINADLHDDAWWFGFSCKQLNDVIPAGTRISDGSRRWLRRGVDDRTYKTEGYVYAECVRLAIQLKAIEEGRDPETADPGPTQMVAFPEGDRR